MLETFSQLTTYSIVPDLSVLFSRLRKLRLLLLYRTSTPLPRHFHNFATALLPRSYSALSTLLNTFPVGDFGIAFTTSIPPLNHLYLLSLSLTHASSLRCTSSAPRRCPAGLRTIQARGTLSSVSNALRVDKDDVIGWETPATAASVMSFSGWSSKTASSSAGDTCAPDIFNVSLRRSTKLKFGEIFSN